MSRVGGARSGFNGVVVLAPQPQDRSKDDTPSKQPHQQAPELTTLAPVLANQFLFDALSEQPHQQAPVPQPCYLWHGVREPERAGQ